VTTKANQEWAAVWVAWAEWVVWAAWICNPYCKLRCPVIRAFETATERAALREGCGLFLQATLIRPEGSRSLSERFAGSMLFQTT
jgi:hypothetical protein